MKDIKFTIPLNPVTKKNSQSIAVNKSTNKVFITQSKRYKDYERDVKFFLPHLNEPLSCPCEVECHFYMPTRRRCDLTNLEAALDDILVKYGVLEDDNYKILVSHDGSRVHYDKETPRTEVTIRQI